MKTFFLRKFSPEWKIHKSNNTVKIFPHFTCKTLFRTDIKLGKKFYECDQHKISETAAQLISSSYLQPNNIDWINGILEKLGKNLRFHDFLFGCCSICVLAKVLRFFFGVWAFLDPNESLVFFSKKYFSKYFISHKICGASHCAWCWAHEAPERNPMMRKAFANATRRSSSVFWNLNTIRTKFFSSLKLVVVFEFKFLTLPNNIYILSYDRWYIEGE